MEKEQWDNGNGKRTGGVTKHSPVKKQTKTKFEKSAPGPSQSPEKGEYGPQEGGSRMLFERERGEEEVRSSAAGSSGGGGGKGKGKGKKGKKGEGRGRGEGGEGSGRVEGGEGRGRGGGQGEGAGRGEGGEGRGRGEGGEGRGRGEGGEGRGRGEGGEGRGRGEGGEGRGRGEGGEGRGRGGDGRGRGGEGRGRGGGQGEGAGRGRGEGRVGQPSPRAWSTAGPGGEEAAGRGYPPLQRPGPYGEKSSPTKAFPPPQKAWGPRKSDTGGVGPSQEQRPSQEQKPSRSEEGKEDVVQGITSSLSSSSLSSGNKESVLGTRTLDLVPARKDKPGRKEGKPMMVEVNFFPLTMKDHNIIAYQYDVSIEPDKPKYMLRPVWNEFVRRNIPNRYPSFDGNKIAVSAGPMFKSDSLSDSFDVVNPENKKPKSFKITVKLAAKVNLQNLQKFLKSKDLSLNVPMAELAVIDIVLRNNASNILVRAGRNFFRKPEGQIISLGDGLEVWYGYYQSAILGWKTYLNFDIALKGFPTCNIIKTIQEMCLTDFRGNVTPVNANTTLSGYNIEKLERHLRGLKVEYALPNDPGSKRVFKVNGVRSNPACRENFEIEKSDGTREKTNVVRYYQKQKNYNVRFPNLPALWVGSVKNNIYVPIELCTVVPGQVRSGKLNETQTSNMIKLSEGPAERKLRIKEQLRNAGLVNNFTNEFGISVASELEKVEARVLNPPKLQSGQEIAVRRGQWETDKLLKPKDLKNWCLMNLDYERTGKYERDFIRDIMDQARRMGMRVENPICDCIRCDPFREPQNVAKAFMELKNRRVELAFVIIPDKGNIYSEVKKISEIEVGVLTQCIRSSTLNKSYRGNPNRSTFSNILLKVNAKLNGVNHALHETSRPACLKRITMIVGADVTHPSPDAVNMPSIAAVAASHDPKATQYYTIRRMQPSKVEVIQDFEEIMKNQLMYFFQKTNLKPERIIVFRDGVSEGQVDIVLREELMALRRACISVQKEDYRPAITFLIVQKRHHTRFFPLPGNPFCDARNPNVPAGTCVDSEVVHPRDLDFYLVSHASRLGTARPTKYKLIYDDSEMTEPELETLTYYLCHLLSRCSKSISYPAPTYYAHLAALRARVHLAGATGGRGSAKIDLSDERKIKVQDYFTNVPMFFV